MVIVNFAHEHFKTCVDALKKGYHVICEKPVAITEEQVLTLFKMSCAKKLFFSCTNTFPLMNNLVKHFTQIKMTLNPNQ